MAPPEPRGRFLSWLHPDRKAAPLPSSQLPPATFPTSYKHASPCVRSRSRPRQTTQSAPCATAVKAPKKPCVLTSLFVKLKGLCHGAGCDKCKKSKLPRAVMIARAAHARHAAVAAIPPRTRDYPAGPRNGSSVGASIAECARSAQLGPNRAMSRSEGNVFDSPFLKASTNRRSASSRCSATSGCCSMTLFWSHRSSGLR